jgi:hypothetical protein
VSDERIWENRYSRNNGTLLPPINYRSKHHKSHPCKDSVQYAPSIQSLFNISLFNLKTKILAFGRTQRVVPHKVQNLIRLIEKQWRSNCFEQLGQDEGNKRHRPKRVHVLNKPTENIEGGVQPCPSRCQPCLIVFTKQNPPHSKLHGLNTRLVTHPSFQIALLLICNAGHDKVNCCC